MQPQVIDITLLHWNKDTNTFSNGASGLPHLCLGRKTQIKVVNSKTGNWRVFKFMGADMNSTQEGIYGWNYKSEDDIKLLIIND